MTSKGQAGKSTREMAAKRHRLLLILAFLGLLVAGIGLLMYFNADALGISGFGLVMLIIFLRIFSDLLDTAFYKVEKLEKRAIRGAVAEEKIGALLATLPEDEFYVFHDVESPYGNIDHLVIAKQSGIFLLETKAHGGRVTVEGDKLLVNGKTPEKDFIMQALRNAYWVREKMGEKLGQKPWITPIVVFTNAFVPRLDPIKGVHIVNKKYLKQLLSSTGKSRPMAAQVWEIRETIESILS